MTPFSGKASCAEYGVWERHKNQFGAGYVGPLFPGQHPCRAGLPGGEVIRSTLAIAKEHRDHRAAPRSASEWAVGRLSRG